MESNGKYSTDRLCALSDGVYSIVLTLLVLDLRVPEIGTHNQTTLIHDLAKEWQSLWVYVMSFIIIADLWMRHHHYFRKLPRCNYNVFVLNFIHMLFLTFIPFTTSLADQYDYYKLTVCTFILNLGLCSFTILILRRIACANAGQDGIADDLMESWFYRNGYLVITIAGTLLAWVDSNLSLALVTVVAFIMFISRMMHK